MNSKMCFKTHCIQRQIFVCKAHPGMEVLSCCFGALLWQAQKPPQRDSSWAIEWGEPEKAPLVFIPKQDPLVRLTCHGHLSNKMKNKNPSEVTGDFCITSSKKQFGLGICEKMDSFWLQFFYASALLFRHQLYTDIHLSCFWDQFSLHLDLALKVCKKEIGSLYPCASFPIFLSFV